MLGWLYIGLDMMTPDLPEGDAEIRYHMIVEISNSNASGHLQWITY